MFLFKNWFFFKNLKILQVHFCVQRLSQHFLAEVWVWRKLEHFPFSRLFGQKWTKFKNFFASCSVSMVTSMMPNMKCIWTILSDLEPPHYRLRIKYLRNHCRHCVRHPSNAKHTKFCWNRSIFHFDR